MRAAAAAANAAPPIANWAVDAEPGAELVFELVFRLRSLRVAHCARFRVFWFFDLRPVANRELIVSRSTNGKIGSANASIRSLRKKCIAGNV